MADTQTQATFPVQGKPRDGTPSTIPACIHMAAYEVYAHVEGPQPALTEGWARGGFGVGELVVYLYARSFPRTEWKERCREAFRLKGLSL